MYSLPWRVLLAAGVLLQTWHARGAASSDASDYLHMRVNNDGFFLSGVDRSYTMGVQLLVATRAPSHHSAIDRSPLLPPLRYRYQYGWPVGPAHR